MKYLISLIVITIFFISCSKNGESELFKEIEKNNSLKNYSGVLEKVEVLKKEYPKSESTFQAIKLLQDILGNNLLMAENPEKRYKYILENHLFVYENFPEKKESKNALFMVGFIYAENFGDTINAKKYYNLFLEKFPNDELVPIIKTELINLGKTPEQLLNEKLKSK